MITKPPLVSAAGKFFFGLACLLAAGAAHASEFQYTTPRGVYTVKVPGAAQPGTPARTYVGIQLLPDMRLFGKVDGVSGNTVSFQGIFSHAQLATAGRTSYLHVLDGNGRGFITDIMEFRNEDIVCAEDLTPWMQWNAQVLIRPHPVLSDVLGAQNPFGLGSGPDAGSADNAVVWDADAQQERVYYFNSTRSRWEEKDIVADAGNAIFRFPYGFYIVRRSPGTLRIALSGDVATQAVLLPVRPAANVFSLPVNLSGSLDAIVTASGPFAVQSGPNANRSDVLTFEEPTTGLQRGPFYHLTRPGASGWREVGVDNSTAAIAPLDFLSTLVLHRDAPAGRVLVEGSLVPPAFPRPPLPPDPDAGEVPLTVEFPLPPHSNNSSDTLLTVEVSPDMQNWSVYQVTMSLNNVVTFDLPAGQTRAFYRLKLSLAF